MTVSIRLSLSGPPRVHIEPTGEGSHEEEIAAATAELEESREELRAFWLAHWRPLLLQQHGRLHGDNVLVDARGSVWLINFADAGAASPFADAAALLACLLFECVPCKDERGIELAGAVVDAFIDAEGRRQLWEEPLRISGETTPTHRLLLHLAFHVQRSALALAAEGSRRAEAEAEGGSSDVPGALPPPRAADVHVAALWLPLLSEALRAMRAEHLSGWQRRVAWNAARRLATALCAALKIAPTAPPALRLTGLAARGALFYRPAGELGEAPPVSFAPGQMLLLRSGEKGKKEEEAARGATPRAAGAATGLAAAREERVEPFGRPVVVEEEGVRRLLVDDPKAAAKTDADAAQHDPAAAAVAAKLLGKGGGTKPDAAATAAKLFGKGGAKPAAAAAAAKLLLAAPATAEEVPFAPHHLSIASFSHPPFSSSVSQISSHQSRPPRRRDRHQVKAAFDKIDKDGSGRINVRELRNALGSVGLDLSSDQAQEILLKYDTNKSGLAARGQGMILRQMRAAEAAFPPGPAPPTFLAAHRWQACSTSASLESWCASWTSGQAACRPPPRRTTPRRRPAPSWRSVTTTCTTARRRASSRLAALVGRPSCSGWSGGSAHVTSASRCRRCCSSAARRRRRAGRQ